jgi:hypothetical protein
MQRYPPFKKCGLTADYQQKKTQKCSSRQTQQQDPAALSTQTKGTMHNDEVNESYFQGYKVC